MGNNHNTRYSDCDSDIQSGYNYEQSYIGKLNSKNKDYIKRYEIRQINSDSIIKRNYIIMGQIF